MTEQTEASLRIAAPAGSIMGEICDFEAYPEWSPEFKEVEVLERFPDGKASKVRFAISAGPVNATYTLAYRYEPEDRGLSWTLVEGSPIKSLDGEYVLEPDGDGTTVTYRLRIDVPIPGPGFVKNRLRSEAEKRIIDTALKGLKTRVESRA